MYTKLHVNRLRQFVSFFFFLQAPSYSIDEHGAESDIKCNSSFEFFFPPPPSPCPRPTRRTCKLAETSREKRARKLLSVYSRVLSLNFYLSGTRADLCLMTSLVPNEIWIMEDYKNLNPPSLPATQTVKPPRRAQSLSLLFFPQPKAGGTVNNNNVTLRLLRGKPAETSRRR